MISQSALLTGRAFVWRKRLPHFSSIAEGLREVFSKLDLKQNLKIKTFVGTNESAVKTQIWTALITVRLLEFLQQKSSWQWSLSNLAALLRFNLLSYRELWTWLADPFGIPIREPEAEQLALPI